WDGRWEPYGNCAHEKGAAYANACHRTHIHISLTWNGAMGRTTFWTGKVHPTDYGPCRQRGLNWAGRYTHDNPNPCPSYPQVRAPKGASATKKALVEYSGARVHRGSHGPVVDAVQRALHVPVSDVYGSSTVSRVRAFQRRHHLGTSGVMNQRTWRALLTATH
ncbi:peptidoglycan-binding domain-containing protein, partial [Jatrophihabitans endophyticus]|uniref:peptidoglycan-binding domain-containing protein n=1 Tax=Jatrophihabitans endophyticus TaxID=1206085 RepID=UPI0019E77140